MIAELVVWWFKNVELLQYSTIFIQFGFDHLKQQALADVRHHYV